MPTDDPAEQARLNAANIAYIEAPAARDAYRLLMVEAEARDIETSVLASNGAKTLRFYRKLEGERSYFFSCDPTRTYPSVIGRVVAFLERHLGDVTAQVVLARPTSARRSRRKSTAC